MKAIVIDFEMNQPHGDLIQLGAVKVDLRLGTVHDRYDSYIYTAYELSPRIGELTGITTEDIQRAPDLSYVLGDFWEWTEGCRRLVAWGSDVDVLMRESNASSIYGTPRNPISINLKAVCEILRAGFTGRRGKGGGLLKTLEAYDLGFFGEPHNALDDAYNTALLAFEIVRRQKAFNGASGVFAKYMRGG